MKLFLAITMGFCTFAAVHSAAIKRDSPDFVLDLYDDEQCDNQNKQIDISEHLRIFAQKPVSTTDIWRGCVVYTDPFRSVKFEIPEGSKYATRSGDDCRVDVYEGRDCQGPIIASKLATFSCRLSGLADSAISDSLGLWILSG